MNAAITMHDELDLSDVVPDLDALAARIAREAVYRTIAAPILRLGYAALPRKTSPTGKVPAVAFGWLTSASPADLAEEIDSWDSEEPAALWLLDALPGSGMPDLDVVDYDDLADRPWGIPLFGASRLTQTTGRDGGGEHHVFRRDTRRKRDETGSIPKFVKGKAVDWKTWHGYVVAPGSLHPSGRVYQLYWEGQPIEPHELTREMILSLPVLDRDVVDRERGVGVEDAAYQELGFDRATTRLRVYQGGGAAKFPKEKGDEGAVVPTGAWTGMTVEAVARSVGSGESGICCPHAGRVHRTDQRGGETARLHAEGGRPAFLVCFACGTTYTYGSMNSGGSRGSRYHSPGNVGQHFPTNRSSGGAALSIQVTDSHLTPSGHLDVDKLLGELRGRNVVVLQLGRGLGKTTVAAEVERRLRAHGAVTVAVAPTRSLTSALAGKMNLPHYEATTEKDVATSLATCTPSLPRVRTLSPEGYDQELRPVGPDLLIGEEVEQQIRSLAGTHLDDWQATRAWHALVHQVRHARFVLLLDADAGSLTEHLLRVAGRLDDAAWFTGREEAPKDLVLYDQAARWHADLAAAVGRGERPYVYVQSVPEAETIARMHPGLTLVTGGERGTISDFDLTRINDWAGDGKGLVTTPALGTGVSLDPVGCFDHVWVYGNDGLCTADDVVQGICRPRHPKSKTVRAFFRAGRKPAAWERDPEQVLAVWQGRAEATAKLTGFTRELPNDLVVYDQGLPVMNPGAASYARAMALAYAEAARKGRGWTAEALAERIRDMGGRVLRVEAAPETPEVKAVKEARKEARKEVKAEAVEAVVCATILTEEQLELVKRRGPRTRDEALGLKRLGIERFYGSISPEVVVLDDDGRGRAKARTLAHVEAVRDGGTAHASVERMDEREVQQGASLPRQRHALLRARGIYGVLERVGLDGVLTRWAKLVPDGLTAATAEAPRVPGATYRAAFLDDAKVKAFGAWAATPKGKVALTYLGYTVRRDAETNPMQLVGSILRSVGLALHAEKINGNRRYHVLYEDYLAARNMVGAYKVRLASGVMLGLVVDDLDDLDAADLTPGRCLTPEAAEALLAELGAA